MPSSRLKSGNTVGIFLPPLLRRAAGMKRPVTSHVTVGRRPFPSRRRRKNVSLFLRFETTSDFAMKIHLRPSSTWPVGVPIIGPGFNLNMCGRLFENAPSNRLNDKTWSVSPTENAASKTAAILLADGRKV